MNVLFTCRCGFGFLCGCDKLNRSNEPQPSKSGEIGSCRLEISLFVTLSPL